MLFRRLLDLLVSGWETADNTNIYGKPVDLIVPISYSILPHGLTQATRINLDAAIDLREQFPNAFVALSNCAYTFPGAAEKEKNLRDEILRKRGIYTRYVWAEDMNNSVQEAKRIKEAMEMLVPMFAPDPRCIVIVTCQMHSRSAKYIWRHVFPRAEILCYTNNWIHEAEPDQPVKIQRSHWLWFFGNIARQMALVISYKLYGDFRLIEDRHHKSNATRG